MDRETDWKLPAALILAGLALFVALSGRSTQPFDGEVQNQAVYIGSSGPQGGVQVQVAPTVAPPSVVFPSMPQVAPNMPFGAGHHFGFGGGFSPFRFIIPALLIFLAFRFFRRRSWHRYGPGGPGGYGPGPWRGRQQPGPQPPQPEAPQQPQAAQAQAQSYQVPNPPQGRWVWQEDPPPAPTAPPSYGDITRPGQGSQE